MKTDIGPKLEKLFNKYSFSELNELYEEIVYTYMGVRCSKYNEEVQNNANFGVDYIEDLYNKDEDFRELINGITNCARYEIKVLEFELENKLSIGSYNDTYQCGPEGKVRVLEKFKIIAQEEKLSNSFSKWWIDKFAKADDYFKDKNIYRISLLEIEGNKLEYNVAVSYNKDCKLTS